MRGSIRKIGTLACLAVLLMAAIIGSGCSQEKEGQLPTYKVGNKWTYQASTEGQSYTLTYEVTGEDEIDGIDCWIAKATMDPDLMGLTGGTMKLAKATLFPVQFEASGTAAGSPLSIVVDYSFQPSGTSYYPLEVGKEVNVTETTKTTATVAGQAMAPETETETHVFKVEAVEELTVAAGTFTCFKITDGTSIIWYSDKVKQDVKHSEDGQVTEELKSYSV